MKAVIGNAALSTQRPRTARLQLIVADRGARNGGSRSVKHAQQLRNCSEQSRGNCAQHSGLSARSAHRLDRLGFTLLEVIIALSLSLLLLTAVYGAIRLQYRMGSAGREQMERAQLSRAILREIENDLRSVVWQVQKSAESSADGDTPSAVDDTDSTTGATGGGSSTNQSSSDQSSLDQSSVDNTSESTDEFQSADEAFTGGSSGIFGDTQNLVLHISRPSRSLVYATSSEEDSAAAGRSDLASVSYFMADSRSGGLAGAVAQQNGGGSSVLGGIVGLARLEGDRLSIERAGETSDVTSLASAAKVLAPEVVAIEFAYWDGFEWLDSWDSVSSGTLPSAIGITLSMDTETTAEERSTLGRLQQTVSTGQPADTGKPVQIRYVVAVPLAEPYVSEASF